MAAHRRDARMDSKLTAIKRDNAARARSHIAAADGSVDFFPRYIQLEQTNRCNARCIMCNHFYLENRSAQDLSSRVVDALESVLPACEVLMLNGDGEPFLHPDIARNLTRYAAAGVRIGTNTNLSHIPEHMWELIAQYFSFLNISCDGARAQTFELIRDGLSFGIFMANLKRLEIEAPRVRRNLDCVVMRQNIDELPALVDLAANHGFQSVRFHRLGVNPCIGNDADADWAFADYAAWMFERAVAQARNRGISIEIPVHTAPSTQPTRPNLGDHESWRAETQARRERARRRFPDIDLAHDYLAQPANVANLSSRARACPGGCPWAWERCYIDVRGNVSTCCYNTRVYLGNLLEQSFGEVWNGAAYRALRRLMMEDALPSWCRSCAWIESPHF